MLRPLASIALLASLAACSGGGDSSSAPAGAATAGAQALIGGENGRKGALAGATACLDLDGNGACGATEPQATTGSDGRFVITLPEPAAARAAFVVEAPATARADGAPLGRATVLRAPAGVAVVSPLSTLVLAEAAAAGLTPEVAATRLQARAALALSPLADPSADAAALRLARLLHDTTAVQAAALEGQGLAALDIERELWASQAAALADLAAAARDADTALADLAAAMAQRLGPDADWVRTAARVVALAEPPLPAVPVATGQLSVFRYTDANNWFIRSFETSAADAVADAAGFIRYADVYAQSASPAASMPDGVVTRWSGHPTAARASDLHWNGSAWVSCGGVTARFRTTVRDSLGRNTSDYCDGREPSRSIRRVEPIAGQDIARVLVDKIRSFPGGTAGVSYASWGPSDLSRLSGINFPAGAYLFFQTVITTDSLATYSPESGNRVLTFAPGVAAGGDVRTSPSIDCNNPALTATSAQTVVTTLDEMLARFGGKPCIFARGGVTPDFSLDPNEWWGQSTLNMGDLANFNTRPAGTGAHYTTTATLRVSFSGSNRARFHRCYRRTSDNGPRNCTVLGIGSYRIDTVGDARVLSFSTMPAIAQRLGYDRVFIERAGAVYFGFRNPVGNSSQQVRINLIAANAIFEALGMPSVRPVTQPGTATGARAALLATVRGNWGSATDTTATVFRFGDNGRFFMADAKPPSAFLRDVSGGELGWFDIDPVSMKPSVQLEVDSNQTAGLSNDRDSDEPLVITDTALGPAGAALPRLPDGLAASPSSLVGLWALGSATDLAAPHLALFDNGRALLVLHRAQADCLGVGQCPPGAEFSQFTVDLARSELRFFGLLYDTNGCQGWFDNCPASVAAGSSTSTRTLSITLAADGRSFSFVDDDDVLRTFFRIPTRP